MKSGKDDNVQMTLFDNVENALETENRTRSSMLWEVDRILKELYEAGKPLPKVLLMENVTEVHNEQNNADFTKWQANLKKDGYTNSFADLAANDYGIPQKRVRTFMVSVLNGKSFTFPAKEPLTTTVQDLMDKNVDNKYYLSTDAKYKAFMGHNANYANNTTKNPLNSRIAATLTTSQYKRAEGGNFYSDKVTGEVDLFSILHPKTAEQVDYSKNILSKLERGETLTKDEANKQGSMFSDDAPLDDEQLSFDLEEDVANLSDLKELVNKRLYHLNRYVPNKRAKESNLKYWIKTGKQIRVHEGVRDFVEGTTKDFSKLPIILQKKIRSGTLTINDIKDYVKTAKNMDDFTFKAIAKLAFKNDELAKLTPNDMYKLQEDIIDFAEASYISNDLDKIMSPKDLKQEVVNIKKNASDSELERASKYATSLAVMSKESGKWHKEYIRDIFPATNQLNIMFFEHYKGNLSSLRHINTLGKTVAYKQLPLELKENVDTGELEGGSGKAFRFAGLGKGNGIDDLGLDDFAVHLYSGTASLFEIPLDAQALDNRPVAHLACPQDKDGRLGRHLKALQYGKNISLFHAMVFAYFGTAAVPQRQQGLCLFQRQDIFLAVVVILLHGLQIGFLVDPKLPVHQQPPQLEVAGLAGHGIHQDVGIGIAYHFAR